MNCGQGIQAPLGLAPVVFCRPVAREFLNRRELHALRCIRDRFPFRPPRRGDPLTEIDESRLRDAHPKRSDGAAVVFARRSGGRRCHSGGICGVGGSVCAPHRRRCKDENHQRDGDDCGCGCDGMGLSLERLHAVLLERNETRWAGWDPSDEGIDDTFVSTEATLTVPPRVSRHRYQGLIDECASREHASWRAARR